MLTARFFGCEEQVVTDRDGYFRVHLRPNLPAPPQASWHSMELDLAGPEPVRAKGQVFIPSADCRRVVISDIDDTVMRTGVANKVKMLWRLFVEDAENRVAFPGVAALYRALYAGPCGAEGNPMLYVSRAPWGIYDMLSEFFVMHRIPVGPVLFLREWGLSWTSPLPRRAEDHKRELIDHMLALYHDLPFVLIGDSGQHDPEVYAGIVAAHPGRVAAVYIRNVSRDAGRLEEIARLAEAVEAAGSSLVLAADSLAMAEHAAEHGLIARDAPWPRWRGNTAPFRRRAVMPAAPVPAPCARSSTGPARRRPTSSSSPAAPTRRPEPAGRRLPTRRSRPVSRPPGGGPERSPHA